MKILLLGEYSRLHNTLKEALLKLGHEVVLVSDGDFFKNFPSDYDISSRLKNNYFTSKFVKAIYRFTNIDLFVKEKTFRIKKLLPKLVDYDVVQLINQDAFGIYPIEEIKILKTIFNQNKKAFVLACGDDTHIIDYYEQKRMKYSILTPVHTRKISKKEMYYSYKYLDDNYKKLYDFIVKNTQAIIPTDMDYVIPYKNHNHSYGLMPNPVNIDKIEYKRLVIKDKINIFFGINKMSFYKKGADIVIDVLNIISKKYSDKVNIEIVENLPYKEYINKYDEAHIFIDQLYSYDQGYNALEAMAKGKCVLTGAEKKFEDYYKLQNKVAVNAIPDKEKLFKTLENLILNPSKIIEIGENARKFIEIEHNYLDIAKKYLDLWKK